jgi:hypothetical protein
MFFGGSITHSHFARHLGEGEWRELLRRADTLLPRHRYERVPYDFIADYALSKVSTVIAAADEARGTVTVDLEGRAVVPLRLWVFTGEEGDEHRFETTEAFTGRRTIQCPA